MTNEGPRFFDEARRRMQDNQQEQAKIRQQQLGGCIVAAILCTFMVCVTGLIAVWLVWG